MAATKERKRHWLKAFVSIAVTFVALPHHRAERRRARFERGLSFERRVAQHRFVVPHVAARGHLVVGADLGVSRVHARQQAAAGGRRERRGRIHVGEADAACCQRVDVGRFDARLAVTAEIAVAGVVHQDEDHIGLAFGRLVARNGRQRGDGCGPQDECAGEGGSFHFGFLFSENFLAVLLLFVCKYSLFGQKKEHLFPKTYNFLTDRQTISEGGRRRCSSPPVSPAIRCRRISIACAPISSLGWPTRVTAGSR